MENGGVNGYNTDDGTKNGAMIYDQYVTIEMCLLETKYKITMTVRGPGKRSEPIMKDHVGSSSFARVNVNHSHAGFALDLTTPNETAKAAFDMPDHLWIITPD